MGEGFAGVVTSGAQLYAFDLVALDGDDLRDLPLFERKARLNKLLDRRVQGIFKAPFEPGEIGPGLCILLGIAREKGFKGIVASRGNAALTLARQLLGWKRSSAIRQPPVVTIAIAE